MEGMNDRLPFRFGVAWKGRVAQKYCWEVERSSNEWWLRERLFLQLPYLRAGPDI